MVVIRVKYAKTSEAVCFTELHIYVSYLCFLVDSDDLLRPVLVVSVLSLEPRWSDSISEYKLNARELFTSHTLFVTYLCESQVLLNPRNF